ncbi:MAG: protein kinase [Gammaproteobacteria bacterium]|nr:protein kinase [Gammaproteobacteria bacterium]
MAKVIPIGEPVNDAERRAIAHLRDHLPDTWLVPHNFEIRRDGGDFEVDIAVIAPHAVFLVDAKGTRGPITVHGRKWYPKGRAPFSSPLLKLRGHARSLKGAICDSDPGRRELGGLYVDAVVLLTAPDAELLDPAGQDARDVARLDRCVALFQDRERIPRQFSTNVQPIAHLVLKALQGAAKKRTGPLRLGNWEVAERLGGTDAYTEYRAFNVFAGPEAGHVRLRLYRADPYLPAEERAAQRRRIGNAYAALARLPAHPNIIGARDFFSTDAEDGYVLVTDDSAGEALRLRLRLAGRPGADGALTLDQKRRIARGLLAALDHAHRHGIIHRNPTPDAVLLGADGQPRLGGFEFARAGAERSRTIAREIIDDLDPAYLAPEVYADPERASAASDIFGLGILLYELFTGEQPFGGQTEVFDCAAVFPQRPSALRAELGGLADGEASRYPAAGNVEGHAGHGSGNGASPVDAWLQGLCALEPAQRPSAAAALAAFDALWTPAASNAVEVSATEPEVAPESETEDSSPPDYANLPVGSRLTQKYLVQRRLGRPGSFGVVYQVVDTLGDVTRAVKLILRDRHSTLERLKQEYRLLLRVPEHPHLVRVIDADLLPRGGPPFIVFDYVAGLDVGEMIDEGLFSPEDTLALARQVAAGLAHLHQHNAFHCDIKPRNLIWTDQGAKIIDFNVSVRTGFDADRAGGGGSRRYLPPDLDWSVEPTAADLADRDLYALGLTLYEALTGRWPWDTATPPAGQSAPDPRTLAASRPELESLAPELVAVLLRAIAPRRGERYGSAAALLEALAGIEQVRRPVPRPTAQTQHPPGGTGDAAAAPVAGAHPPNTNPFVDHLLGLHGQSRYSNRGTRGLDEAGRRLYVETALDRELVPMLLAPTPVQTPRLVLITGNAGDGKTAFLQRFESLVLERGGALLERGAADCRLRLDVDGHGRSFRINYDGSQDDEDRSGDEVLRDFFAPYAGDDGAAWPGSSPGPDADEIRLIAINEGRLLDFLASERSGFGLLEETLRGALTGAGDAADLAQQRGIALVNLNLRSVVARVAGHGGESIFEQLLRRMVQPALWQPCQACDLKARCYVHHNALSFQDSTAGPKLIERLLTLYTLTHLRGRLHITLRDLGSALAYMLAGARNCAEIHDLYAAGRRREIVQGFYFNSWMGGDEPNADRLLRLLADVDPGFATDPRLDRALAFVGPAADMGDATAGFGTFSFAGRGGYDRDILQRLFDDLPRDLGGQPGAATAAAHRHFLTMSRRRAFFERRDGGWRTMVPYRSSERMLAAMTAGTETNGERQALLARLLPDLITGINRGEGLSEPARLGTATGTDPNAGGSLALLVREVENGTIRSYRLFPAARFSLAVDDAAVGLRFVEHMPNALLLRYHGPAGDSDPAVNRDAAALTIDLDVFEMLMRLNAGYRPTVEEQQGHYLNLIVFKNLLGSEPYREVLLTTTGHDFFRVQREDDGRLTMERLGGGMAAGRAPG